MSKKMENNKKDYTERQKEFERQIKNIHDKEMKELDYLNSVILQDLKDNLNIKIDIKSEVGISGKRLYFILNIGPIQIEGYEHFYDQTKIPKTKEDIYESIKRSLERSKKEGLNE